MAASTNQVVVVIPARLGSRRFPRKVLARETGKYLVEHVWERVVDCPVVSRVIVATDSDEVVDACASFGAEAWRTSPEHRSGTDRVAEVGAQLEADIIVNVQGDEPLIAHEDIERLVGLFDGPGLTDMSTLVARRTDREGLVDPNIVKAVLAPDGRALYFSRSPVPWPGDGDAASGAVEWWHHIGIYAYRKSFLLAFAELEPAELEQRERLEQLRALVHGYCVRAGEASAAHPGIDTPEEYEQFVAQWRAMFRRLVVSEEDVERNAPGPDPGR